jgi:hypothetical protein
VVIKLLNKALLHILQYALAVWAVFQTSWLSKKPAGSHKLLLLRCLCWTKTRLSLVLGGVGSWKQD